VIGERRERPVARERQRRRAGEERAVLVDHVATDLLAEPFGAAATQADQVGRALLGGRGRNGVHDVRVDGQREIGDASPQGFGHTGETMPDGGTHRTLFARLFLPADRDPPAGRVLGSRVETRALAPAALRKR
jgi:hypothetical protein